MLWSDLEISGRAWDPWREFEQVNRRFSDITSSLAGNEFPMVNVWTNGDGATVTTEIPGIDPAAVDISVVGRTLTLRGSRKPDEAGEGESFHRRERWQGRFTRAVELPFLIDANKVEAHFSRGVLKISLPRAEADKPKKITIKSE
jgi:HSP20 family protein